MFFNKTGWMMIKKIFGLCILLFLFSASITFSQDHFIIQPNTSLNVLTMRPGNWNWDWDWQWNNQSRPMIELNYGSGTPKHSKFGSNLSKVGLAELKLGFSSVDYYFDPSILEFHERFFYASNISTDLKTKNNDPQLLDSDLWRFGFGWRSGYGYETGPIAFIPYIQYSISWSKLNMQEFPDSSLTGDIEILNKYNDSFRFGVSSEGGVRLEVARFIALNAAYETNTIFPRHLFWKHAGSLALEVIGLSTIDSFVEEILESSPAAGPILNFVLKAGYMYAFYHLKKDKMNWPFDSEAPLTYETFKIGTTFVF